MSEHADTVAEPLSTEPAGPPPGRTTAPEERAGRGGLILLFGATLFVSAALLFTVQPLVGKMLLPLLGGAPAVWNTCMLFFQAALLAGYAYAHGSCRWLGVRRQMPLHIVVLLLPLLFLPLAVGAGSQPPGERSPILWLLAQLTVTVGVPFVVVSTTAPLLQRWFASTGHPSAADPYFLYAASNAGSLLALLAYPAVLEPTLRLTQQTWAWAATYAVFVLLVLCCAVAMRRTRSGSADSGGAVTAESSSRTPATTEVSQPGAELHGAPPAEQLTLARRLGWVFLAFVPSSLMLGVTTYITTDIAAVPLLWVLPLGLYLLSFIIVFARQPLLPVRELGWLLPFLLLPLTLVMSLKLVQWRWAQVLFHLLVFFVAAVACHARLAAQRPAARHLTEYYFWMAVGGVLGGIFNALVAPLVFTTVLEYPLALALACCGVPGQMPTRSRPWRTALDLLLPLLGAALWAGWIALCKPDALRPGLLAIPTLACLLFLLRPVRLMLGVLLLVGGQAYLSSHGTRAPLCLERNFFGVKRVTLEKDGLHLFIHGGTIHGAQYTDAVRRDEPLIYYHPSGPAGDLFQTMRRLRPQSRVGVVGLGIGTVAAYARPTQHFTFYEIDPAVARIAQDPRYFTYLSRCAAPYEIVLGDGRLTLAQCPDGAYDLLLLDAFNSDAIPTHLLTREALQLYLRKLAPDGWLVFHCSSAAIDLTPVLANLAAEAGLACLCRDDQNPEPPAVACKYIVMARRGTDVGELVRSSNWRTLPPAVGPVWTDQYSNLLQLIRW